MKCEIGKGLRLVMVAEAHILRWQNGSDGCESKESCQYWWSWVVVVDDGEVG